MYARRMGTPLFLVVCDGGVDSPPMVLAAYIGQHGNDLAHADARTITGASVLCLEARSTLRDSVREDVSIEFDDIDTPIDDVECLEAETPPMGYRLTRSQQATVDRSKRRPSSER